MKTANTVMHLTSFVTRAKERLIWGYRSMITKIFLGITLFWLPILGSAQINAPKIGGKELSGDDPVNDLKLVASGFGEIVLLVLQFVVYIVGGYMVIVGFIEGWKKGEWGKFAVGIIIVFVMLFISAYFFTQGESALEGLAS